MSKVRERILEVASTLFYERGIQAVGVDAIIARADVARMSFYRHFKSKEGRALAFLERRDQQFRSWLEGEVDRLAPDPRERPLAVFDALALRFAPEGYRGCAFLNTMAETPDRDDVVHRAAAQHKEKVVDYLKQLLRDAGFDAGLAADLILLVDGAVVSAVREGSAAPALRARRLAGLLLGAGARAPERRRSVPRSGPKRRARGASRPRP
jgi:AcrR family transcriptional regulator